MPANPRSRRVIAEAKIRKLEADYLEVAEGGNAVAIQAVREFFDGANEGIRWVKRVRRDAEPSHLQSLFDFAGARVSTAVVFGGSRGLAVFLSRVPGGYGLDHEGGDPRGDRLVLTSPKFSYRVDLRRGAAAEFSRCRITIWPAGSVISCGRACPTRSCCSTPRRAICTSRRSSKPRRGGCCKDRASGRWRSNSGATGWTFAISSRSAPWTASASRHSATNCGRRCSRSRFASSWTCFVRTVRYSISFTLATRL